MTTFARAIAFDFTPVDDGVSLLGLPAKRSARRSLPGKAGDVLKTIASILDDMLVNAISQRTAADFQRVSTEAFPRYFELVMAFSRVVAAIVPRQTIGRLASESFSEIESDLRQHGDASFGGNLRERAIFTVWTLRKTGDLLELLEQSKPVGDGLRHQDTEFASQFLLHALRARFHVDCLTTSMRTSRPLYPEILPLVDDGLRSVVDAYAWAKQAVDLRLPVDESEPLPEYWSNEDRELVNASMRDLARSDIE